MAAEGGGGVVSGNAVEAAANTRGWFLGHFMPGADLRSEDVELKWFTHRAGDTRPEWAPGNPVRTLNGSAPAFRTGSARSRSRWC